MACLCVPEGEFEELLEHVPLSKRRKLLLSSAVPSKNEVESSNFPGLLSLPPCSAENQVDQNLPKECSPDCTVTAGAFEIAIDEHPLDSGVVAQVSQYITSCQDAGLPRNDNNQGSQTERLTGTEANADVSRLEINVRVPQPPNSVPLDVSDSIKVDCAGDMLMSLSKDDTEISACTALIVSCQDVGLCINDSNQGSLADQMKGAEADASGLENINVGLPLHPNSVTSNVSSVEKVDCADKMLPSLSKAKTISFASTGAPAATTCDKKLSDFTYDELDHIVLNERRKLLLKRKLVELEKPTQEGTAVGLAEDLMEYSAGRIKQEFHPIDGECMTAQNLFNDIPIGSASDPSSCSANGSSSLENSDGRNKEELQFVNGESWLVGDENNNVLNRSTSDLRRTSVTGIDAAATLRNRLEESNIICSGTESTECKLHDEDDSIPASSNNIFKYNSTLDTSVKLKVEPLDYNNLQHPERITIGNLVSVKCEEDIYDQIDHMLLRDRMKLLTSVEHCDLNSSRNFECLSKTEPAAFGFSPIVPESAKSRRVTRPRKSKKTATDSVLTALEEDAPELLKVLLDQGVSVDEIKLYGESEDDDALDESFNEDSFSELEAVMTKLFSQRVPLLKFAPIRCTKGSKPTYCFACLFSLVEQARYVQFRGWPVEWGWCRDLQSFIFVFKRHHRIVLERPEYGYATYFFELLDSLPIDWQVKRLVIAMKLTSCGRITLIENKPLSIGEDLTEGEGKVLMEYGWMPNTGLGTMLNYCDRVVHDRKNESDSSEWRSKIGKLLVDGHNGGTIVSTSLAENVIEHKDCENTQVKVEF